MTELVLLLPLKVLPGWPEPEPVSRLFLLMLCVVGPLALAAVIAAIANAPRLLRRGHEDAVAVGLADDASHRAQLEQAPSEQASLSGSNPDGSARRGA